MAPEIVAEDHEFFILNKPPGWVVNDADTTRHLDTIQSWLADSQDYPLAGDIENRSGIVHRLDKETSGVLIVAKNYAAMQHLQKQFKERKVKKKYTALVHGKAPEKGEIAVEIGRLPWNRKRFGVISGGRESYTSFITKSRYQNIDDTYSLLSLTPRTGRTHQIRVHMKHLGHSIVSDELYAGRKTARADRKWCPRLFLHATEISFAHPHSGKMIDFSVKLPPDLLLALSTLEKGSKAP